MRRLAGAGGEDDEPTKRRIDETKTGAGLRRDRGWGAAGKPHLPGPGGFEGGVKGAGQRLVERLEIAPPRGRDERDRRDTRDTRYGEREGRVSEGEAGGGGKSFHGGNLAEVGAGGKSKAGLGPGWGFPLDWLVFSSGLDQGIFA